MHVLYRVLSVTKYDQYTQNNKYDEQLREQRIWTDGLKTGISILFMGAFSLMLLVCIIDLCIRAPSAFRKKTNVELIDQIIQVNNQVEIDVRPPPILVVH